MIESKDLCKINISKLNKINHDPNMFYIKEKMFNIFKPTNTRIIEINKKKYVIKKELTKDIKPILKKIYKYLDITINESVFYKKYKNIIKKSNFNKKIQIPIKYNVCDGFNIYLFEKLKANLNSHILRRLNEKKFINLLSQTISTIYFINHKLKIFHNDLHEDDKIRNIMIDNKGNPVVIDFGLFDKKLGFKNRNFYKIKSIQYGSKFKFRLKSELFIVLYIFLINYYRKENINIVNLYRFFYDSIPTKKIKSLENFDKNILLNVRKIRSILDN